MPNKIRSIDLSPEGQKQGKKYYHKHLSTGSIFVNHPSNNIIGIKPNGIEILLCGPLEPVVNLYGYLALNPNPINW